jgi:hypothetical protein
MKKSKNALVDQAAHPASIDTEANTETGTETTATDTTATDIVLTEWDKRWQGYCKYAIGLHRRPDDLADFEVDLQGGRRPDVTEPAMMTAALHLVAGIVAAGVRRWDWLPAPRAADLPDPAAWAARRLAERGAEQDEAERVRHQQRKLARALGQVPPAGNGTGRPVYRQRLGRPLAEVGDELARVIAEHQSKHGEFKRQWLDPNSPRFIAGVTNKEVIMMASEISGRQEERPYDQNWTIVTNWLRNRQAQQTPDEAE